MARNVIKGTSGDDVLRGTNGRDIIKGRGGDDIIKGKGGGDILIGGSGDDVIYGQKGRDVIRGNSGDDELHGNKGRDVIHGGIGTDDLWGGTGPDIFKFGRGDGLWSEYPNAAIERLDNIVWDYKDGVDKFNIPNADIPGALIDNINFIDAVGGQGAVFAFGEESVAVPPNINDPHQNTAVFLVGFNNANFDAGDFI